MTIKKTVPLLVVAALCAVALIGMVVALAGAYYAHWDGPVVTRLAHTLPIPAASVGGRSVLLRTYLEDVRSVERFLSSPEATRQNQRRPIVDTDKQQVLERLVHEAALQELAEARSITVTSQQVQAVMDELTVATTSTEAFQGFLDENYGWTTEEFQSHVVEPLILTRLLTDSYAADHGGDPAALEGYLTERVQRRDVIRYVKF